MLAWVKTVGIAALTHPVPIQKNSAKKGTVVTGSWRPNKLTVTSPPPVHAPQLPVGGLGLITAT